MNGGSNSRFGYNFRLQNSQIFHWYSKDKVSVAVSKVNPKLLSKFEKIIEIKGVYGGNSPLFFELLDLVWDISTTPCTCI